MFYTALTVDIDPDANGPHHTRIDSCTTGTDRIYIDGCREGLRVFNDAVTQFSLPATLFWEARTLRILAHTDPDLIGALTSNPRMEHACHGLRHEDLTAIDTASAPESGSLPGLLSEATDIIRHYTGATPHGFRAPYCRLPDAAIPHLAQLGYRYDASITRKPGTGWQMRPYTLPGSQQSRDMWELALTKWSDRDGNPISGYLWRMFKGERPPQDHVRTIHNLIPSFPGGLYQLALHPWHLIKKPTGHRHNNPTRREEQFRDIIKTLTSSPDLEWVRLEEYLRTRTP